MTANERVIAERIVEVLNEMLSADPAATHALVANHVPCNPTLAEHPTIQVDGHGGRFASVGMLGVLNGLAGVDAESYGPVAAVYDSDMREILRFELRQPSE